jgi:hypothetical protein
VTSSLVAPAESVLFLSVTRQLSACPTFSWLTVYPAATAPAIGVPLRRLEGGRAAGRGVERGDEVAGLAPIAVNSPPA